MKRNILLTFIVFILSMTCIGNITHTSETKDVSGYSNAYPERKEAVKLNSSGTITMIDFASFLMDKKEHYPLSDEFVERYQQTSGGYITLAKQLGMEVDKQKHLPNQKWHFFDSWLIPSIEDEGATLTWDSDARNRVYTGLLSPELLLWIYEASGVDPAKVKLAKDVAELGRASGTHIATLAKNMRDVVSWEDLIEHMDLSKKMATSVEVSSPTLELSVGDTPLIVTATPSPALTTDVADWQVLTGETNISLMPKGDVVEVQALKPGTAVIRVTYNTYVYKDITVTVTEPLETVITGIPHMVDLDIGVDVTINPVLNIGGGSFTFESSNNSVVTVTEAGMLTGVSYGSATVTIQSVEHPDLIKVLDVEVFDHGSDEKPLSVEDALGLVEKLDRLGDNYNTQSIYIEGVVENNPDIDGYFKLLDKAHLESKLEVIGMLSHVVAQHDEIILKGHVRFLDGALVISQHSEEVIDVVHHIRGQSKITLGAHLNSVVKVDDILLSDPVTMTNGSLFSFTIEVEEGYSIDKVLVNEQLITSLNDIYTFEVLGDTEIKVLTTDVQTTTGVLASYDVLFDLGTRKTSRLINDSLELLETFSLIEGTSGFITAVSQLEYIYGGGYGGRGDTNWYVGNMLKFGTTSVNGSMTLELSSAVNRVEITGYIGQQNAMIQLGDSNSTDWTESEGDQKTVTMSFGEMNIANKDTVEAGEVVTLIIDFEATSSLKISTISRPPLYITAIKFINHEETA